MNLTHLATLHTEARRLKAARAAYEAARVQWQKLAQVGLAGLAARAAEARILHDLATLSDRFGDQKAATAARQEALRLRERNAYTHGLTHLRDLARTQSDLGSDLAAQGGADKAEGLRLLADARRLRERLADMTAAPGELALLAESHNNEAIAAITDGRPDDADAALRRGREVLDKVPADRRDTAEVATHRGQNLHIRGVLHVRRKEFDKALAALGEARAVRAKLADIDPTRTQPQVDLAYTYVTLGNAALGAGDGPAAIDWYGKAREVGARLAGLSPEDVTVRDTHALNTYSLANALHRAGRPPTEVAAALSEATASARAALAEVPGLSVSSLVLDRGYRLLAEVRRKQGDAEAAAAAARDRLALAPDDPARLIETAADLAQCVPLVSDGPGRDAARKRYADEAVAALTRAAEKGFKDSKALSAAPFAALRERDDFKALVAKLSAPKGKD